MAQNRCKKLGFNNCEIVDSDGLHGGIWIAWDDVGFNISIVKKSNQFIHVLAEKGNEKLFITSVYASTNVNCRRQLWEEISDIQPTEDWPWIVGGDFNATLYHRDRRSNANNPISVDRDFVRWFENLQLNDLECVGPYFTWHGEGVESRIDQVVANNMFKERYTDASIKHLPWFK
ncbi:uncharacterized protein LOC114741654 [Neltuma alba]|uniref:uncharacterized protein LOC114741654 n=1 Tax=Neltuma alba TaxID=207710 RepID=UPI0010A520BA|nr:uncharacterized protein LOC114741654 [Prosopis alba]